MALAGGTFLEHMTRPWCQEIGQILPRISATSAGTRQPPTALNFRDLRLFSGDLTGR
jgi:hypothetical protein